MFDPDGANQLHGGSFRCLVEEVRHEFFRRTAQDATDGLQVNSARVVTIEVYDRLSIDAQVAIVSDLMHASGEETSVERDAAEVFARSDTPRAHITDLVCELVHQELMDCPLVMMENERREALWAE